MNNLIRAALVAASLAGAVGCSTVTSSLPGMTNTTGEAWYTEAKGFFGMTWGSSVWYCPAATAAGPTTCTEAKLIPLTKEQVEAQQPK